MKQIRKNVFETNSSSTHSLTFLNTPVKQYYSLTKSGYIMVGFDDYYLESDYSTYSTLEEKLTFIFSMVASFMYDAKFRNPALRGSRNSLNVTRDEFMKNKDVLEIRNILQKNIPNCKGFMFKKHSFNEKNECSGSVDTHHFQNCLYFQAYLKQNHVTLEQLIMSPHLVIQMNG